MTTTITDAEVESLRAQLVNTRVWAEDEQRKRIKAEEDRTDARSSLAEAREVIKALNTVEPPKISDLRRAREWLKANGGPS
jgi:hypothetical protein